MTVYVDQDGFEYEATVETLAGLLDVSPDDPEVITESDVHPSQWED